MLGAQKALAPFAEETRRPLAPARPGRSCPPSAPEPSQTPQAPARGAAAGPTHAPPPAPRRLAGGRSRGRSGHLAAAAPRVPAPGQAAPTRRDAGLPDRPGGAPRPRSALGRGPRGRPHPAARAARELVQTQLPQVLPHRGAHGPALRLHRRASAPPVARQRRRARARALSGPRGKRRRPGAPRPPGGAHAPGGDADASGARDRRGLLVRPLQEPRRRASPPVAAAAPGRCGALPARPPSCFSPPEPRRKVLIIIPIRQIWKGEMSPKSKSRF